MKYTIYAIILSALIGLLLGTYSPYIFKALDLIFG